MHNLPFLAIFAFWSKFWQRKNHYYWLVHLCCHSPIIFKTQIMPQPSKRVAQAKLQETHLLQLSLKMMWMNPPEDYIHYLP
jgi:hypothetical protein